MSYEPGIAPLGYDVILLFATLERILSPPEQVRSN